MTARLIVEAGVATPAVLDLDDGFEFLLGRNRTSHLFLQDRHASRQHARLVQVAGAWVITDLETTNGTRIDGQRIESATLADKQVIAIGEVRLRFRAASVPEGVPDEPIMVTGNLPDADASTHMQVDELSSLVRFVGSALVECAPQELVSRALDAIIQQSGATLAGFMSLDPEQLELRLVRPLQAAPDARLSMQLTQAVLLHKKRVWLGENGPPRTTSESLSAFHDAMCIPLRSAGGAWGQDGELPLGALHVYRAARPFTEREAKFCEIIAAYLSAALVAVRDRRALVADNERLRDQAGASDELVGSSPDIVRVREQIRNMAPGPGPVLICGETGVGKELAALGLHRQSTRHHGPLVVVHCDALRGASAEAELFGSAAEGSALARPGFFAQADMGTLFLDEVCELSLDLQGKLVRAIETRRFLPVNARSESRADVRVIAATRRDPQCEVREGRMRHALFYRLSTRIIIPPLRDRINDIPELAQFFLEHLGREHGRTMALSPAAVRRLMAGGWPGNVRQLRSVLEAAVAIGGDRATIQVRDLCLYDPLDGVLPPMPDSLDLGELEKWAILHAMHRTGGNVAAAARMLGIHRGTLYEKLKEREGEDARDPE